MTDKNYDEAQKRVIFADGEYNLVLAPPGCGKTEILAQRIIEAHRKGVPFSDMLCLTFTNRASRGMLKRIRDNISDPAVKEIHVGNIHHFCSQFLFNNGIVPQDTSIIDELDVEDILNECGAKKIEENNQLKPFDCTQFRSAIHAHATRLYQDEFHHPKELYLHGEEDCTPKNNPKLYKNVLNIGQAYYDYKKLHNMMDFDDILMETYTAMMAADFKEKYNEADFPWIQVDEVQDLNPLQFAIIDKLTSRDSKCVMYLGDEQQAIFSFMGARLKSLDELKRKAGGNVMRLEKNYRSPSYLLDVYNKYAETELHIDREFLPQPERHESTPSGGLEVVSARNGMVEYGNIARITKHIAKKYPNEKLAITVRSNAAANEIADKFSSEGIPFFQLSGKDVFKSESYKAICSHLAVVSKDNSFMEWARLLWATKSTLSFKDARNFVKGLRDVAMTPSDFLMRPDSSYIKDFYASYRDREIVIFDTETTGLNVYEDDIIQIAAIKVKNGEVVPGSEYDIILKTEKEIPAMLGTKVNPMVAVYNEREKLSRREGLEDFLAYVGDDEVLGHNSTYDLEILHNNVLRDCPGHNVHEQIQVCWDSLKIIRLLRPYFRIYKLEALLEILHLEGQNSHKANDDILATKSLVDWCFREAKVKIGEQNAFLRVAQNVSTAAKFTSRYKPLYEHTVSQLDSYTAGDEEPKIIVELRWTYDTMVSRFGLDEQPRINYVFEFLSLHILDQGKDTHLRNQLMNHMVELNTFTEADLCDSDIIKENVYVLTVHKAKGLEFETVIVHSAVDGTYPHFKHEEEKEKQEDRRVFYVAMSRAKKRLVISFHRWFYSKERHLTPFMDCVIDRFDTLEMQERD